MAATQSRLTQPAVVQQPVVNDRSDEQLFADAQARAANTQVQQGTQQPAPVPNVQLQPELPTQAMLNAPKQTAFEAQISAEQLQLIKHI